MMNGLDWLIIFLLAIATIFVFVSGVMMAKVVTTNLFTQIYAPSLTIVEGGVIISGYRYGWRQLLIFLLVIATIFFLIGGHGYGRGSY